MFKRSDIIGLLIGLIIVMVVVALTLPNERVTKISAECYHACRTLLGEDVGEGMGSSFSYVRELSGCVEYCVEEKDENSD